MVTMRYFIIILIYTLYEPILCEYVRELTDTDFDSVVLKEKMVLVNFYAHWCPHCQRLKPIYMNTAKTLHQLYSDIPVVQIDCAGEGKKVCTHHDILSYPTIKFFHAGRAEKFDGERTEANLVAFVKERVRTALFWGDWSSWSKCSVSCGFGKKTRSRLCLDPATQDPETCIKGSVETKICEGEKNSEKSCIQRIIQTILGILKNRKESKDSQ